MIDFTSEIDELRGYKREFDAFSKRLFDLTPEVKEEKFPVQERFAIAAQILFVRYNVACIIARIQERLEDELGMDIEQNAELMQNIYISFDRDNDMPGILIEEIVVFKTNNLLLSFMTRYCDIILSLLKYCESGDDKELQRKFREIRVEDMLP